MLLLLSKRISSFAWFPTMRNCRPEILSEPKIKWNILLTLHQGMKICFTAPAMMLYNQKYKQSQRHEGDRYEFYQRRQLQQRPGAQAKKRIQLPAKRLLVILLAVLLVITALDSFYTLKEDQYSCYYDLRQAQHGLKLRLKLKIPYIQRASPRSQRPYRASPRLPHGRFGDRGRIAHDHLRL